MNRSASLIPFVVALAVVSAGAQCTLTPPFTANNGLGGNTFDVQNLSANTVRITQVDVNVDAGTWDIQLWAVTANTSAAAVLNTQAAWTQVGVFPGVTGAGLNLVTVLPGLCTPIDIPAGATTGLYYFATSGSPVNYLTGTVAGATNVSDGTLRLYEGWGMAANFTGAPISGRIASVVLHYVCPGPPGPPPAQEFQINGTRASMTVNGAGGSACQATVVNQALYTCGAVVPATGNVALTSVNVGLPWDIVMSAGTLVAASAGGITVPGPQYININFGAPFIFLNGLFANALPGLGVPGLGSTTLNFGYSLSVQTDIALQGATIDPTTVSGLSLTQATELHVIPTSQAASVPGPTTDNSAVTVNVTASPTCFAPAGIPFYGVFYTSIFVQSNGRVTFVGTDTDASATVAEGLTDNPFVGCWMDLNPALGGSITVTNPGAGIVRVNYNGVPYAGEAATANSFGIQFDTNNGFVTIDGLTGIVANPQTALTVNDAAFLGITRGNTGATSLGVNTAFANPGGANATNATHNWYDFYLQVAGGAGRPASLVPGTLNSITFFPSGGFAPNYDWLGG